MKYIITTFLIFITPFCFAQIQVGGGIGFGSEVEQICIDIKGKKDITEEIDGSVSLNFFLPDKIEFLDGEIKTSIWTINLDGHYNFSSTDKADLYGLAGINIANIKVKSDYMDPFFGGVFNTTVSDSEFGLNIGGGGQMGFNDSLTGFGEVKYTISDLDQLVIVIGVLFNVGG